MPPVLLDTDILVYVYELRDPLKQNLANVLVKRLESDGNPARKSDQSAV